MSTNVTTISQGRTTATPWSVVSSLLSRGLVHAKRPGLDGRGRPGHTERQRCPPEKNHPNHGERVTCPRGIEANETGCVTPDVRGSAVSNACPVRRAEPGSCTVGLLP